MRQCSLWTIKALLTAILTVLLGGFAMLFDELNILPDVVASFTAAMLGMAFLMIMSLIFAGYYAYKGISSEILIPVQSEADR